MTNSMKFRVHQHLGTTQFKFLQRPLLVTIMAQACAYMTVLQKILRCLQVEGEKKLLDKSYLFCMMKIF